MIAPSQNQLRKAALVLILGAASYLSWPAHATDALGKVTTVYPSMYFEVRDHDAPTKYVFDGATRIARVTGSLSNRPRIQRLRVYAGWNLCSVAVTCTNALAQLAAPDPQLIQAAYKWSPASSNWLAVTAGETLPAGTVLCINARSNAVLIAVGAYAEPVSRAIPAGDTFLPSAGFEAWPLNNSLAPNVAAWLRSSPGSPWQVRFTAALAPESALPPFLAPGQALFVQSEAQTVATNPDPALRICYYHADHLGSASIITDAQGALVEETEYYPFGAFRNQSAPRSGNEPYHFTGKERDPESGLQYFGKRFYQPALSRWLSTDPKQERGGALNLYAYAKQNPLKYQDPDGSEITLAKSYDRKSGVTTYTLNLQGVVVSDAKKSTITREQLEAFKERLTERIKQSYQGQEGKTRWRTTVDLKVVDKVPGADSKAHVFKIVDATVHGARAAGTAWRGGRTMEIDTATFFKERPGATASEAERKGYQSAETVGAHEFGHAAGLMDRWVGHKNLMSEESWYDNADIEAVQLKTIVTEYNAKHLNLSDQDAAKRGK